jgi:hypothetical protein
MLVMSVLICLLLCALIQLFLYLSKKMNEKFILLRKNYLMFEALKNEQNFVYAPTEDLELVNK